MEDRKTYFLDLQTLLTYLRGQSCVLTTEVSVGGRAGTGYVTLRDGVIANCLIQFRDGAQLAGKEAYERLESSSQWQVQLAQPEEESPLHPPQMSPPPPPAQMSPQSYWAPPSPMSSPSWPQPEQPQPPWPPQPPWQASPGQMSPQPPWQMSPRQTAPRLPTVPGLPAAPGYPYARPPLRPKRALDASLLQNLPMRRRLVLRMVYAMVNGQRSEEEIMAQLQLSPEVVVEALAQLRMLGVIE